LASQGPGSIPIWQTPTPVDIIRIPGGSRSGSQINDQGDTIYYIYTTEYILAGTYIPLSGTITGQIGSGSGTDEMDFYFIAEEADNVNGTNMSESMNFKSTRVLRNQTITHKLNDMFNYVGSNNGRYTRFVIKVWVNTDDFRQVSWTDLYLLATPLTSRTIAAAYV